MKHRWKHETILERMACISITVILYSVQISSNLE